MDTFCGAADDSGLLAGDADDTFRQPPDTAADEDDEDILVREGVVVVVVGYVLRGGWNSKRWQLLETFLLKQKVIEIAFTEGFQFHHPSSSSK